MILVPARAHHSHGNYTTAFVDVEGVVKEVHLRQPALVDLSDGQGRHGAAADLGTRGHQRIALERMGITPDTLKPGDPVKARCHPLRDGSRGCLLGFLKTKDGSIRDWDGNNLPIPKDL